MGKTLYLIKQKVPDTTTNALTNAETILNTVLDAVKDVSYNPVANLLINTPDLSATHDVILYQDANKTTQKLKNSDIFLDMFDQQYAVFVSEYQKQTTWDGNDPSYNDGTVFHTNNVGYSPAIDDYYKSYTSVDPASAPLYDATIFITTDEVNTGLITDDSRFKVNFDTTDGSGRHQVFKAINSSTYRIDSSSGLVVEEVPFNVNAGLVESYIVRGDFNALSIDTVVINDANKLTDSANGYDISYANNIDVSYGAFKFVQSTQAAGLYIQQNGSDVAASDIYMVDGNGFVDLPSTITSDEISGLFSDSTSIGTTYSFQITNNGGGGYSFSNSSTITDNGSITIDDTNLVRNENYMNLITNQTDLSYHSQYFTWTNGTVTASAGPYTSNITIGTGAESLAQQYTDASGIITFFASDLSYNASSAEPQRSRPDNWNNTDILTVDYDAMDSIDSSYYFTSQYHKLETRVLLPSTNTNVLTNTFNTYEDALGSSSASNRYITASDNLVFFKSGTNNESILPSSFTVNTNGTYDQANSNPTYATIFEIGSDKSFTNQSTLLEEEQLDGSYVEVPGSIVSIIATNVDVTGATDYRFKMNPKKITNNTVDNAIDTTYDFPTLSNNFAFVAYDADAQTYDAENYLTTLKSNLNILGNDIYSIMENSADLNLNIEYKTNGTATNADSLKNYFDISYSFVVGSTTTTGTHRIEDLNRITTYDETQVGDLSSVIIASIGNSDINSSAYYGTMSGWKLMQYEVETTYKVRTQLYLGAYSNLYVETPVIRQTDTRYGLVTSAGVAKPDYYLKYLNHNTAATRNVQIESNHSLSPVSNVTLSVDDLKTHIGDIQYTSGDADNDIDINWDTIAGPKSVDPNFDSANSYTTNGSYSVYIDVPKAYTLDAPQYIIRMEAEPSSVSVKAYTYNYDNAIFSANDYGWDITEDLLTSYTENGADESYDDEVSGLTITYDTDESTNITTISVFKNSVELFNIQRSGNITQKIRIVHNPRGIAETISITSTNNYSTSSSQTFTKYGTVNGNTVEYNMDTGITFQLDERFRDTSSTKSVWFLTQDVVTLQRVIGNENFNDLSYQTVDQSTDITLVGTHNLTYGVENGVYDEAKTVTFAYYRGNALGNSATIDIARTKSSLQYVMTLNNGATVSTGGDYGPVYYGFTATTTPEFYINDLTVGNFGLQIDGIANSILDDSTSTQFNLYMNYDSYTIVEYNGATATSHSGTSTVLASAYTLFAFDGSGVLNGGVYAGRVIDSIVATTIKAPTNDDFFKLTKGSAILAIYYSPEFVGHMNEITEFPDASWSILGGGVVDDNGVDLNASSLTPDETAAGFYFNNGAIYAQRTISAANSFTCYLACPPPQLKVTGVVVTDENASYHGSLGGRTTLQRYDPTAGGIDTYSYYIDVDQRSLQTTYYPFADYANGSNYMNNIELYEDSTHSSTVKSIRSYRSSQSYSKTVDIKENKFSIYEYSGIFAEDSSASSPYDEVESTDYILINNTYLSTLSTAIGTVTMDDTYAYYTLGIKQNKYPLTLSSEVDLGRYSTPNLKFTIGSPFLLESGLNYYAGFTDVNGQLRPSFASDWVPVNDIGQYVLPLEFNVGNSTRFTLYGTNFTYKEAQMTMTLKKYSTNFGIDYSDFPRELSTVTMYAKNKSYKQITLTRPTLDENDISGNTSSEEANTKLIAAEFANESWSDISYTNETRFISGNLRFEFVPATSYVFDVNSLDISANLVSDGAKEILSLISVTEDEPRKILFMNLEDSNRPIDGSIFGNYLPKTMTNYSGQIYESSRTGTGGAVTYIIPMKEKISDTENIYTVYGY